MSSEKARAGRTLFTNPVSKISIARNKAAFILCKKHIYYISGVSTKHRTKPGKKDRNHAYPC